MKSDWQALKETFETIGELFSDIYDWLVKVLLGMLSDAKDFLIFFFLIAYPLALIYTIYILYSS